MFGALLRAQWLGNERGYDRAVGVVGVRHMAEALDASGPTEEIALRLIAQLALQELELGLRLHPFGQDREAQPAPKPKDGANDGRGLVIRIDRPDKRAVDLDLVERERQQVGKRGIAGAEIVHRDANAQGLDQSQR